MSEPKASAGRTRRIDEIGAESRRRILDAAEELFAEKGFEKTSFVDIAARSGISRGSIPWHFQNKDGLLIAVVERGIDRYMTNDDPSVPLDDLLAEWKAMVTVDSPGWMFMVMTEAMTTEGLVHDQYVSFFRTRRKLIAAWLQARGHMGDMRSSEVQAMATIINAALQGIQLQWVMDPKGVDLDGTLKLFGELIGRFVPDVQASSADAAARRKPKASK